MDARILKSRKALLDAALTLLLRNPAASLKEIAEFAQVGRATLYRHFDSRESLVQALALQCLEDVERVIDPIRRQALAPEQILRQLFEALIPLGDRYHFLLSLWEVAEQDPAFKRLYQQQLQRLSQLLDNAKATGTIRQDLDTEWLVTAIDSLLYAAWWQQGMHPGKADHYTRALLVTLFEGIGNRPA
ncbi:TetR/AcrR family transcriptional regulator [Balneatrix alpica]|uniref:TetR/AcrR family transcriptional regulator n=1 Tax=Balneatrix alpica TaxID=75684 RepID=A0ABV5ZFG5_9GAMM|nr:TetR/AcrR family transcriptional regulator [Balneatrix alpica]